MEEIFEIIEEQSQNEQENSFENYRTDLVTKIAFLIGVSEETLDGVSYYDKQLLADLRKNEEVMIIRNLCILRTQLFKNYEKITQGRANLILLEQMHDLLETEAITYLRSHDIEVVSVASKGINNVFVNVAYINQFLLDHVDKIKPLVYDWVKFEYVKALFLMPNCNAGPKGSNMQSGGKKIVNRIHDARGSYLHNKHNYPFQMYINWPRDFREEDGNVLFNDAKFLKMLYGANGEMFSAKEYVIDAKQESKDTIYNFVDEAKQIAIFVDCENVNPYCFAATLLNLEQDNLQKIKNIVLYDDVHTSAAWDYIEHAINIPVTHKVIPRVVESKSLVDTSMATGVAEAFYRDNTESVILASSDSDFWGVIASLPAAKFYVLNEKRCTASAILEKLDLHEISHCFMDTFAQDKVQTFKTTVLVNCLKSKLDVFNNGGAWEKFDVDELIDSLFEEARIVGAENQIKQERKTFHDTYIKKGLIFKPVEIDGKMRLVLSINR